MVLSYSLSAILFWSFAQQDAPRAATEGRHTASFAGSQL
jgi:hypothetical protein